MEKLRLWLAELLYGWACRLAGHDMISPRAPDAPGAWGVLHAQRHERIAREWHAKYMELRKRGSAEVGGRMVQF
jgi:hypothetical protein